MLTLAVCYLLWMVTYMAQLHPLICKLFTVLNNIDLDVDVVYSACTFREGLGLQLRVDTR